MAHFSTLFALSRRIIDFVTVTTDTTAAAITYTAASLIGGLILRDPNGLARADLVPTATAIIEALTVSGRPPVVGSSFWFSIRNTADLAETITVTANTGVTLSGTMTIAQNNTREFLAVVTAVSVPAVTIYSLGTAVH